ncbi:MAG: SDR family oxidoreductase [Rhizobiales bacterium]|nr:SDR family oxidoreductase [Hyphomicrobiales bacterium]
MKNLFSVKGKVALVTGGTRGIGYMIARGFVENGVRTYISARKADVCDQVARELSEFGECRALPADLSTLDGVKDLAARLTEKEPALDILVNNAGAAWGASIDEFPEAGWDKVMDLNVKSLFFMTQALLPNLEKAGTADSPARIINIGSVDGITIPHTDTWSYPASKAAVHQLTKVMANRLADRNINVNAVAPGPFESQMMAHTLETSGKEIADRLPRKRIGRPEDMVGVTLYLSSQAGAYITGVIIPVDGGHLVVG